MVRVFADRLPIDDILLEFDTALAAEPHLAGRVAFRTTELPDPQAEALILGDMVRTAEFVAQAIQAAQPTGPLLLAGFSFGGCVAYETARLLSEHGRDIAFLGLLDPPFGRAAEGRRKTLRNWIGPTSSRFALGRWAYSWNALRRAVLAGTRRLGLSIHLAAFKFICLVYREDATQRWRPARRELDTWLVVSEELGPRTLPIWQRLCPKLQLLHVPGAHLSIFHPPAADLLVPAFDSAVRAAHARSQRCARSAEPMGEASDALDAMSAVAAPG